MKNDRWVVENGRWEFLVRMVDENGRHRMGMVGWRPVVTERECNLLLDMVYFRDISSSDKKYLVISKDQGDATEKGLSLLVEKPIIGRFSPIWPKQNDLGDIVEWTYDTSQNPDSPSRAWSLRTSLHKNTTESNPLRTLGCRIISGETRWGTIFRINGEFGYTPYYWEWLEDVLSCS
ncbi:hypothetical protein SO802_018625 [Lithocarpus litseifolius]|uniref:Uncharacterized protein n=1 Tax=Lithocarpus litseifolius TaxID=425828 RepID=A0AAW2CNA2_9ROSI